jgi:hypothetical protein
LKGKAPRRKHVPQRTCVACREKDSKRQLVRIVRTADAGVVIDLTGKRPGRGAYLCDQPACWDKALHSNLLDQALKTKVTAEEKAALAAHQPPVSTPEVA